MLYTHRCRHGKIDWFEEHHSKVGLRGIMKINFITFVFKKEDRIYSTGCALETLLLLASYRFFCGSGSAGGNRGLFVFLCIIYIVAIVVCFHTLFRVCHFILNLRTRYKT